MYANGPNDVHLNDENMVHMVDKVLHVDKAYRWHSHRVQMHRPTMVAVRLDCLHQDRDFVFSILFGDFETRFLPKEKKCFKIIYILHTP